MSRGRLAKAGIAVIATGLGFVTAAPGASAAETCYGAAPTITGTPGNDSGGGAINGTAGNDVILALGGDDEVNGNGGNDIVCAGPGEDVVVTTAGDDKVAGQDGDDDLSDGAGDDHFIDGGRGTDSCTPIDPDERLIGCTNPTEYLVGQTAPDFAARTAFDNKFRLSDLRGQNVLLDFSSVWCLPSTSMAEQAAGVQDTLREAGIPFAYVLAELEGNDEGVNSLRWEAERMTEIFDLYEMPVLHTRGAEGSAIQRAHENFASENLPYDVDSGNNVPFPTLVFINKKGKVTEVHGGALTGTQILERYDTGLGDPPDVTMQTPTLPGADIEEIIEAVQALGLNAGAEADLVKPARNAIRALELRLSPDRSACSYLSQFRKTLRNTGGIDPADRDDLALDAIDVQEQIGCG